MATGNQYSSEPSAKTDDTGHGKRPERAKIRGGGKLRLVRKQAPLRRIVKRTPRTFSVEEELECGHLHHDYVFDREHQAKHRRCQDCAAGRPVKLPDPVYPRVQLSIKHTAQINLWSIEGGTVGSKPSTETPALGTKVHPLQPMRNR